MLLQTEESKTDPTIKKKMNDELKYAETWYITQTQGEYCGYISYSKFLVDSPLDAKACVMRINIKACNAQDTDYAKYSTSAILDKLQKAFKLSADKVKTFFLTYDSQTGLKATSEDLAAYTSKIQLTTDANGVEACSVTNYPTAIRVLLTVKDGVVSSIRAMFNVKSFK